MDGWMARSAAGVHGGAEGRVKVISIPVKVNSTESAAGRRLVILLAEQGSAVRWGCTPTTPSAPLLLLPPSSPPQQTPLPPPSSSSVPRQRCQASPSRNREAIWCLFGTLSPGRVCYALLYVRCDGQQFHSVTSRQMVSGGVKKKRKKITDDGAKN